MKTPIRIIAIIAAFFALPLTVSAHEGTAHVAISGKLADEQGSSVDYATVVLINTKTAAVAARTVSDDAGSYAFNNAPAGNYRIKVIAPGYQPAVSGTFVLASGAQGITIPALTVGTTPHTLKAVVITPSKSVNAHKAR